MCTEVWHYPSSSRQTDENRLVATSPAPGSRTRSTGVEAALASLFGFTSEQPDGGRSHCGTPGSRTTALVCPKALGAAEFARNSFANPEGIALSPKTHGLSEDLAAVASPEAAPSTQPELVGCAALRRDEH